ncbi:hypothetical protein [Stenotrophomonas sp. BIGb0135]|uniref:hypothetical protein n=1 Tax=Stenotrophomonas sp. BIGb0135 TaxID=2940620 RepID=UPI0021681CBC|nr:hypothetical protein [Stenotrophomonas sp. BIGb0135]MCS4234415.1 hypothetical protein [Stenotrophomonas sp. BIGb0135]
MDYPKMIYLGGDLAGEYRIVQDEDEEATAEKDGFLAHDRQPKKVPARAAAAEPDEGASAADGPKPKGKPGPKPKAP